MKSAHASFGEIATTHGVLLAAADTHGHQGQGTEYHNQEQCRNQGKPCTQALALGTNAAQRL